MENDFHYGNSISFSTMDMQHDYPFRHSLCAALSKLLRQPNMRAHVILSAAHRIQSNKCSLFLVPGVLKTDPRDVVGRQHTKYTHRCTNVLPTLRGARRSACHG